MNSTTHGNSEMNTPDTIRNDITSWILLLVVSAGIGLVAQVLPEYLGKWRAGSSALANLPTTIGLDVFRRELDAGKICVLDVRRPELFRVGHIPRSLSFPVDEVSVAKQNIQDLVQNVPVVLYCSGTNCNDSDKAAKWLLEAGISNVRILREGFSGWVAAGLPVEAGERL